MNEHTYNHLLTRFDKTYLDKRIERQKHHQFLQFKEDIRVYWENAQLLADTAHFLLKVSGLMNRGLTNAINYEIINNTITIPKLPRAFENFTILQLTDIHIDGKYDHGEKLMKTIKGLDYDLCVITGDFRYLTYGQFHETITITKRLMDVIKKDFLPLGILGNHDFIEMVPDLERLGLLMLINENTYIEKDNQKLYFIGVDDPHFYNAADLNKACRDIEPEAAQILLAHTPEIIEEASKKNIDYYICGHTHGGQICLPFKIPIIKNITVGYKYLKGRWKYKTLNGYTSKGTGSSGIPVRFNCRPEITLHHLKKG